MSQWPSKPFREVFTLKQGKYLTKEEMLDAPSGAWNVPVYGANGIIGYTDQVMYRQRVPLVSCRGANCGVTHLTEERSWISNNSIACVSDEVDPRFYFHVFRITSFADVTGGSAQPQITLSSLGPKLIVCPPLDTQRRIAGILGAYDDLIEVNRRRVAVLEAMARSLFEEWFVRFRFPGHENHPLQDTPNGPLPEGWARISFGEASANFDRLRRPLSGAQRSGMKGPYPYYGAAKIFDYIDQYIFEGVYLLVAEDGSVITDDGFPVLQLADGRFWVNNHAHVVRGSGLVSTEFLYLTLMQTPIQGYITGAAQPKITQAALNRIPVTVADKGTMSKFAAIASSLFASVLSLRNANERLAAARDLLLPRLISGQIDVGTAERQLETAA